MNYSIEELLDYLDLYRIIIDKNLYDPGKKKDVEEINNLISKLNSCYNSRKGIDNYDFNMLRKKIMTVFHPDLYKHKLPKEFEFDNATMIGKLNGVFDDIEKAKKAGQTFNYNYEEYHDSYSEEDIFEEEMANARREERKEKVREVADKVKENTQRVLTYMKERIQASIFNIPSNENDYEHIKETFAKDLRSLDYRKRATLNALDMLRDEKKVITVIWNKELDKELIAAKYEKGLQEKENVMVNAKFLYESAKRRLDSYVEKKYKSRYERIMNNWKMTSDEILRDFLDEKVHYSNRLNGYEDDDPRTNSEMKKDLKRLEREYDQYPKYDEMRLSTIKNLTKGDKEYRELKENTEKYRLNYAETEREYNYYKDNKHLIIRSLNNEINSEYSGKTFKTNMKIKRLERKLKRINNDIMKNIKASDLFNSKYKYEYEYPSNTGEVIPAGVHR